MKTAETVPAVVQASSSVPNKEESTIPRNVAAAMVSLVDNKPPAATRVVTRSNKLIAKIADAPLPPAAKSKAARNGNRTGSKSATTAASNERRHGNPKMSRNEQPTPLHEAQRLQALLAAGQLEISEVQPRYQPGGPIIHGVQNVSAQLGVACGTLEKYYNRNLGKPQHEQATGFFVSFKPEVFHHAGSPFFEVSWEELYHLLNLKEVGTNIMMCQIL